MLFSWDFWQKSEEQLIEKIRDVIQKKQSFRIATVNAEYFLEARKNAQFREAITGASVRMCDGAGLWMWIRLRFGICVSRIAGADFVETLLSTENIQKWQVFFVIRKDGLSSFQDVREVISKQFPGIVSFGEEVDMRKRESWKDVFRSIEKIRPHIILCAFGIPEQELFLQEFSRRNVPHLSMGVGGSLDFLTKKQRRAPLAMRRMGCEWLWRFAHNPRRLIRFLKRM